MESPWRVHGALRFVASAEPRRLGEAEPSLHESLSQLRLAFVRLEGVERPNGQNVANTGDG